MFKVFSSDFSVRIKFIFDMYDFDKDGVISKEDVRTLLSSMPIEYLNVQDKNKTFIREGILTQKGEGKEDFQDRAEIQIQLNKMTELCFNSKENLSFNDFKTVCEKVSSEMFICLYMMIRKCFSDVLQFNRYENKQGVKNEKSDCSPKSPIKVLASPKIIKKFSSGIGSLKLEQNVLDELKETKETINQKIKGSPKHVFDFQNYHISSSNQINPNNPLYKGGPDFNSKLLQGIKGDETPESKRFN